MTIINRSMFPLSSGINNILGMKQRYDKLQTQLSSGMKAANLAELGSDRYFDLALRQRIDRIDSYKGNIKTVNLRLNVLDQTVGRLDTIEADARAATMSGSGGQASLNFQTAPTLAGARFDEVMTLLNVDIAGRYLFGGAKTESKPVEDAYYVLNGRGAQAGFEQVAYQRKMADLGPAIGGERYGRLGVSQAIDTVTLARDGDHVYGLQLNNLTTTSNNITVNPPGVSPPSLSVQFGATPPQPGDQVTVQFTLPDNTSASITLTASTTAGGEPGSFAIGPDAETTAASFAATLGSQVAKLAQGTMVTASGYAASEDFFYGHGGQPMRVAGTDYENATGRVAGTETNTVFWYRGDDSGDPRQTVTAKVGENTSVAYGVQANEHGILNLVRSLATMKIQVFNEADPTAAARYGAMVSRNSERLAETGDGDNSIAMIAVELGLAKSTAGAIDERHTDHKAQLANMLQDIEEAPTEEITMEILALKTRLEASYQTTALLTQLSLVHYLK